VYQSSPIQPKERKPSFAVASGEKTADDICRKEVKGGGGRRTIYRRGYIATLAKF
jgi:hypothetical protein